MKQMIHVTGASCSGSSVMATILSNIPTMAGIGEDHPGIDHYMKEKFIEANILTWDRLASFRDHGYHMSRLVKTLGGMSGLDMLAEYTHFVFKRSAMVGDKYRLDMNDILETFPNSKVLIMYRDPKAATWSSLKNKTGENLRHCAVMQADQLTVMNSQIRTNPRKRILVVSYEGFCKSPKNMASVISGFCETETSLFMDSLLKTDIRKSSQNQWREEANNEETDQLDQFFRTRNSQWRELSGIALK